MGNGLSVGLGIVRCWFVPTDTDTSGPNGEVVVGKRVDLFAGNYRELLAGRPKVLCNA